MDKIKDVDPAKVDSAMSAISSVLKAIINVAKCIDSFKNNSELKANPVV